MARLFARWPEALESSLAILGRCRFSLDELAYDYPAKGSYDGRTPDQELARRVEAGLAERWPEGVPERVALQVRHELGPIARLRYAPYLLTVHDIVSFARRRGILCQGRGSAANSAVCYALGITAVDPECIDLLFERFVSAERDEPPDIDLNIEHERREAGLDPASPILRRTLHLAAELVGTPRHLSQHPGGLVIAKSRLCELVPIGGAAIPGRTVVEWDKGDLAALRMLKIDLLALGMLSCVRRAFDLLRAHYRIDLELARMPAECPAAYDILGAADTVGVSQVESRAQMAMLPRLRPRSFHDLVIQVAIMRPGPIQGAMVHPYLRRREGKEGASYPSEGLRLAIVAVGFTPAEAEGLRRAMAAFGQASGLARWRQRLVEGMAACGYERAVAERCWRQIMGFGAYGFPKSHAASFAFLAYASAWLKRHHPDVFLAAILNAQPMGFYAPTQLVRDAEAHGVEVLPIDVNHSQWEAALGACPSGGASRRAVRLGLRQVKGLAEAEALRLVTARLQPCRSVEGLRRRAGLGRATLVRLAEADAFGSLGLGWAGARRCGRRRRCKALRCRCSTTPWRRCPRAPAPGPGGGGEPWLALPPMGLGEEVVADYAALRLSLKAHPLALLRGWLRAKRVLAARELWGIASGRRVRVCGLVLVRQHPGSAKGVVFVTLEDETGFANLIVWPGVFERFRAALLGARLLAAIGRLQREGRVAYVVAERLFDLTPALRRLRAEAIDPALLEGALSRAGEPRCRTRDAVPVGRSFR